MSEPVTLHTGKWGDVVGPWGGSGQPNFGDINALVAKFQDAASAPSLTRTDLVPELPNQVTNFADINACVGAFQGAPYPLAGPGTCP